MMWTMFILLILTLFGLGYYFLYLKPKKYLAEFARLSQEAGYKTKLLPFHFMEYYIAKYMAYDQNSLRIFKQQWSQYDVVVGNVFSKLAIMVGKPELIKDICNQMGKFQVSQFISEVFKIFNGGGLVFAEGEIWKRKRRIISSVFHYEFLNNMIPVIESEIQKNFSQLNKQINEGKKQFNLRQVSTKILSSVVVKSFFGVDINEYQIQGKPYCECYLHFLQQLGLFIGQWQHILFGMKCYDYNLTKKCRQLKRKYALLQGIAKEITQKSIQKIKNNQQKTKNILTALYENNMLTFQEKQNETQYTMYQLIGQFFTFLAAGTDTTSNTVNLALHNLHLRPDLVEKILNQTKQFNQSKAEPSQKMKILKNCQAVFNESLRTNPPAPILFSRSALQEIKIGNNLIIPKGTFVTPSPLLLHYRKQCYKDAAQFKPQRWLEDKKMQPFTFMAFSGGQRNCIGQYLARIQAKLLLSKICQKYQFKALQPIKMKLKFSYATQSGAFELKPRKE